MARGCINASMEARETKILDWDKNRIRCKSAQKAYYKTRSNFKKSNAKKFQVLPPVTQFFSIHFDPKTDQTTAFRYLERIFRVSKKSYIFSS